MIKCICINDKNMPEDFPNKNLWLVEGELYTAVRIIFLEKSKSLGVELKEIDLSNNQPYLYFDINRFAFNSTVDEITNLIKATKLESEIDVNSEIDKLLNEVNI